MADEDRSTESDEAEIEKTLASKALAFKSPAIIPHNIHSSYLYFSRNIRGFISERAVIAE